MISGFPSAAGGTGGGLSESEVQALIDDALDAFTPPSGGGGGFSYGGDWNAQPSITSTPATTFDELNRCTFSAGVLTTTNTMPTAFVHGLQSSVGQYFRFTWPDIQQNALLVGTVKNPHENLNAMFSDTSNAYVLLMAFGGSCVIQIKNEVGSAADVPVTMPDVGDVVSLHLGSGYVFFNNITKNTQLIQTPTRSAIFSLVIANMGVSSVTCNFALPYPLVKQVITFNYPSDLTKTYRVSAINENSGINGKTLKVGDFVNFISTSGSVSDVVVNRLVLDSTIDSAINTAIEAAKGKLLEEIEILALGGTLYIDPDSDVVVLKGQNQVTGVFVYLPQAQYQYQGKRLTIISYIQSTDLNISTTQEYIYGNLPPITSVQVGDVFEFVAQPHPINGNPVWARIK